MRAPIRTLVVDDNPAARRAICSVIESNEALQLVGAANNGLEALEKAETLKPDLILLDVFMPEMNGLEVAAHLRQRFPQVRLIMVTAHEEEEVRRACAESGAHGFIAKRQLARELDSQISLLFGPESKNENSD